MNEQTKYIIEIRYIEIGPFWKSVKDATRIRMWRPYALCPPSTARSTVAESLLDDALDSLKACDLRAQLYD